MISKKKSLVLILIVLLLILSACEDTNIEDSIINKNEDNNLILEPVNGGQITIPLTNFNTLNPLLTSNLNYYYFSKLIFESLFEFGQDLSPEPKLAEEYSIFNEGKTVSVKLKENIRWHDGEKLTTEDIAFTIDAIKYAGINSPYGNVLKDITILNTKIVDERTIEINFDRQYLNNLEVLTFPIVPKHVFVKKGGKNSIIAAASMDDYTPIGTGPYKFQYYAKNKFVTLSKNENYWKGSPYIDEIVGKVLDDESVILTAFETGQVSFASTIGMDWDKYKQNSRIKVQEYISPNYEFIGFNFSNSLLSGEKGQDIRKAIFYGINRQDIIAKVYLGHGTQIDVPLHPSSYLLSSDAYTYGYNKEKALEILNDIGYVDKDEDGILEDENGNKLTLRLMTNPNNSQRKLVAELIKDYLYDIGIDVKLDFNTQYVKEYDEIEEESIWNEFKLRLNKGDYDMSLLGWQSSIIPNLYPLYHSSMIGTGTNFINYESEAMDQLLLDSLVDGPRDRKIDTYSKIQNKIINEIPYLSLYFINKGLLIDTKIQGELNSTFFSIYNGIENCYVYN